MIKRDGVRKPKATVREANRKERPRKVTKPSVNEVNIIKKDYGIVGRGARMTNNVAEYSEAINAIEWLRE